MATLVCVLLSGHKWCCTWQGFWDWTCSKMEYTEFLSVPQHSLGQIFRTLHHSCWLGTFIIFVRWSLFSSLYEYILTCIFLCYYFQGYYKDTVEFFFEGRNECKNFWKKCVENHGFFRCSVVKHVPRQKTRVLSRGSSFRLVST